MSTYTLHPQQQANYRTSVKALIRKDGKILLARNESLGWEFPGGGLDHGETPIEGMNREFQEELGMTPDRINERPVAYWTMSKVLDEGQAPVWFAFVLYEVEIGDTEITFPDDEEVVEIGYFSEEEIKNLQIQPNTAPYFDRLDV